MRRRRWPCSSAAPLDVVFSDVRMAGMDGLALLREIRQRRPETVVVLMTAYATVPQAVEAMRAGAYDYLVKPFSLDQVGLLLDRVLEVQTLRRDNRALRRVVEQPVLLESASPAMQRVLAMARQVAALRCQRAAHRRERHRQERAGRGDPRLEPAPRRAVRHRGVHDARRAPARERAVRPREGRLHRRLEGQARPPRGRRRRHRVSRRGRRHAGRICR